MARVSTYLNFQGNTNEAMDFYATVFGTTYSMPPMRMGDAPPQPGMPELSETMKNLVMHCELPILAGHVLMATDMIEEWGHKLVVGNNTTINLEPDTRAEVDRLYAALSEGGSDTAAPSEQFWGAYWGTCLDRFGVRWMFNSYEPAAS